MTAPKPAIRIGEAAVLQACPSCRRHTLVALTDGLRVRADPENLSPLAELTIRIQGRQTYDVMIWGLPRRMRLAWRSVTRIQAGRKHPVVADHKCGTPLDTILFQPPLTEIVIPYRSHYPDKPPF